MPAWQAASRRATHVLLYVALLVQPLVGYLGSEVSGYPVKYFGMTLPSWAGKHVALKDLLSAVHLASSWVIATLVTLHVAGALKHALVDRDGLLARMGIGRRSVHAALTAADARRAAGQAPSSSATTSTWLPFARHVERGLAAVVLALGLAPAASSALTVAGLAVARGPHQCREIVLVDGVRIDALGEQQAHDVGAALARRVGHRVLVEAIDRVDVRAAGEQQLRPSRSARRRPRPSAA